MTDTKKTMTRVDGERYRIALENIRDHVVIATGDHANLSTVWQISNKALEDEKEWIY